MISGENPLLKHAPDLVGAEKRGPRKILFPGLILCVPIGGESLAVPFKPCYNKSNLCKKKGAVEIFCDKMLILTYETSPRRSSCRACSAPEVTR